MVSGDKSDNGAAAAPVAVVKAAAAAAEPSTSMSGRLTEIRKRRNN